MGKSHRAKTLAPTGNAPWAKWPYRIGCPVWACKQWSSRVYPPSTPNDAILAWYSRMFPTVEGNSTFYAVPGPETFVKWCEASPDGFRFSFKFPRAISHDHQLVGCEDLLSHWLARLNLLAERDRLGTTFLQLAPSFSSRQFDSLAQFLNQLPLDWPWAVEVRHPDWYDGAEWETRLDQLLIDRGIDRVVFDSRPLNALDASDATETASQSRKPKLPLRTTVTGARPMVRLIGRNDLIEIDAYWDEWADRIAAWIEHGLEPWVFTHAPDDAFAPDLARALHTKLRKRLPGLEPLPTLEELLNNSTDSELDRDPDRPVQLRLF